ncbi:lipase/esterase [Blastococcus saxobsidens]|uniref:Lipase/esterase n=1 Tax=Blastococcus saxobsidens (strain DD2) TaxID=1146883 RepID=H6RUH6_BLASD|nr:lipase/esterase [Blastococcus saxobsidens]CCG01941.1 Lipase/esterase [Blastococcus saxobsidens DD2]
MGAFVAGGPALADPPPFVQPPGKAAGHPSAGQKGWQPVQVSPQEPLFTLEWTIDPSAIPFEPLTAEDGTPITRVLYGTHEGAAYRIEVPLGDKWNGDVVFWEHGYRGTRTALTVDNPGYGLRETYIANGYAWAASSYSANRYDIEAGVRSTEELAKLFDEKVGEADQRYLQGVSMGGHVIGVLLERDSGVEWAGAAPMCGVMGDRELYDFFLDYNLLAQTLADVDAYPIPTDYVTTYVPEIKDELRNEDGTLNERGQVLENLVTEISGGPRPGAENAFAFWEGRNFVYGVVAAEPGGLDGVAPGPVWSNVDTDYPDKRIVPGGVLVGDGKTLDEAIERVAPAPEARRSGPDAYVPDITGDIDVPVLSIHTLGDYYVPFSMEQYYAADVREQGNKRLLVQRAIRAAGHCEFTNAEAADQFLDLVDWVENGVKPEGASVLNRNVVADPAYGCEFTSTGTGGTRGLYAPCPVPAPGD